MNLALWSVLRWWIRLRRGRTPPARLADPIWYFAYGSNMNERLFRERRHMTWREARAGRLHGYRLVFTVGGGMRPGVSAPEGRPATGYLNLIREAARQRGLPADYIAFLDRVEARE